MKTELIKSGHAVGESNFHLQITPAYRQDVFRDGQVAELTLAYILEKLVELKVVIKGYGFGPDHLHLFVSNVRFVSEVELVRQVKGFSSRMMRKNFWDLFKAKLWGEKFWTETLLQKCRCSEFRNNEALHRRKPRETLGKSFHYQDGNCFSKENW